MSPNIPASVRARLLNKSKQRSEDFDLILTRFVAERFLYRLGESPARDRCVLKGAALLSVWMSDPYRATRDVDLLALGAVSEAGIREMVASICEVPCVEDGVRFDVASLDVTPIRAAQEHVGHRAVLRAFLEKARVRVQIDFGTGDAVTPAPIASEYPTLLDTLPAPSVLMYPRVVSIAEKFEAMVTLGRRNSRMKDFHDLFALSSAFPFDGAELQRAVIACFEHRGIPWTGDTPDALTPAFYETPEIQARWNSYRREGAYRVPPPERFADVGDAVRQFLAPVRDAIVAELPFTQQWPAGGPWR